MARQVLPWVGAAVGFWIGGPTGAQAGFAIGGLIGNAVDPQVLRGPQLGEGQNNTASEGGYRPIVLGKGRVGVCMIHQGPEIERTIRTRQSKGGGPVTEEQRRYRTMAFALGESADPENGVALLRIWIDNKLVYDITPTSQIVAESVEFAERFTFYPGNDTQQPDPDLETFMGAGNVPSYRGGAPYIVLPEWDVTDSRGRAPTILAELSSRSKGAKAYAVAAGLGLVYVSQDPLDWGSSFITPASNPKAIFAGGSSVTIIGASNGYVSFNDLDFTVISGLPIAGVPQGSAGIYCEYSKLWLCGSIDGPSSPRIYKSSDGVSYEPCSGSWPEFNLSPGRPIARNNIVMFFDDTGVSYRSVDGGHSFTRDVMWIEPQLVRSAIATPHGFVVVRSDGAIWASPNGSEGTWVEIEPAGTVSANVGGVAYDPRNDVTMFVFNSGSVLFSEGGVSSWQSGTNHGIADVYFGLGSNNLTWNGGYFLIAGAAGTGGPIKAIAHPLDDEWQTVKASVTSGQITGLVVGTGYVESERITLSSAVDFMHERVDMQQSSHDSSALTDMVEGIVLAEGYTGADAIRSLMSLYFFDAGEYDSGAGYRINYVKRGAAAVTTLTENDIVEGPEDWEREDSYERPKVLHVAYQNPVADYGAPNIVIKRTSPDVLVTGERSASVAVVFSDVNEITQRADILMTVIYTEIAGTYKLILPDSLLTLTPTDCIGFNIRGKVRRLRMTGWRYADGMVKTEWMADRQSSYTSILTGLPVVPTNPPPPFIVGSTVSAVLDIPALADGLDSLHAIVAHSGQTPAWNGSVHQRRSPSDPDFTVTNSFTSVASIMGVLLDDVTDASEHFTDTTNTVRVQLYRDEDLPTYTQQQFLSENGAFALSWEDSGTQRWEIMQYRDAVKVGDREWELTTLLRGRLNTETAAHLAGAMFVVLEVGVQAMPMQSAWIGEDVDYRAVSNGQIPDNAVQYTEEYTGQAQREWPVANILGGIASDTLTVTAVPRHRFGTEDNPIRSVNWDGYRFAATDGVNSATLDSLSATVGLDVSGWSKPITVTVSQLNRITGAGPTVSEQFE